MQRTPVFFSHRKRINFETVKFISKRSFTSRINLPDEDFKLSALDSLASIRNINTYP